MINNKYKNMNSITNAHKLFFSSRYYTLLLICICISGCITHNNNKNCSDLDIPKVDEINYIIIEKYHNPPKLDFTLVVDSVNRTFVTRDTIYSDIFKNDIITALKNSHQEVIKFGPSIGLILKTDSNDIYIGIMKNNIKTKRGTFVCKNDLEKILQKWM